MKSYNVHIKGVRPGYMQDRMHVAMLGRSSEAGSTKKRRGPIIENIEDAMTPEQLAEQGAYKNRAGEYFIPALHIEGSLTGAGALVKSKVGNTRKSMKNIVAAMFSVSPDELIIPKYDEIDVRTAVNHFTHARIVKYRPLWTEWEVKFTLNVDNDTITDDTVHGIIEDAGRYIGIGSYRPTANGKFGRFELVSFEPIAEPKRRGRPPINA